MLKLQILVVIIYTASLPGISDQAVLTCESNEIGLTDEPAQDLRVAKGFQRTTRDDPIFVGSNQSLTIIHEGMISNSYVGVCYSTASGGCYKRGNNVDECDNFLRGVTTFHGDCTSGSCTVLACGSNARLARCSFCDYTTSGLDCSSFVENNPPQDLPFIPAEDDGYASCTAFNIDGVNVFQFEKNQNSTFLYDDNTGNVFYGLLRSSNNPVSIIGLASIDNITGDISGTVWTRTDSQKMVATEAHFVGTPFFRGDYVYFLFREPALEVASLSNDQPHDIETYYSRIARICKDDAGTSVSSTQTVTSFLKQRLVCCIMENNECSEELNEIQDFVVSEDGMTIHAIFTNEQYDSPVSALCVFNLTVIDETFATGSFFGADGGTTNDRWRVYNGAVISPRPGFSCSNPNIGDTNFQRDYNLMQDPAVQTNTNPFYLEGDRFSNLEIENDMYIISSERGCLYRLNVTSTETDLGSPCQDPVVSDPIKDLELLPNNYLITTVSGAYNISSCIASEVPEDTPMSPEAGDFTVRPNSVFEFVIDNTTTGSPNITCNEMPVTDDQQSYLVLREESLDTTNTLMLWRILILDDCVVTFNDISLNYIIQTYKNYTLNELQQRCDEWDDASSAHKYLTQECQSATSIDPGTFNSSELLKYNQVQNCADCPYNGCTENSCTP